MDKRIPKLLAAALAVVMATSCGSYNRLLKSHDHEKMYQAGLNYYQAKKYTRTLQLFEEIDPYYAGTAREDTIKFYSAASYYNQGDFETSGMLLDQYRRQHRTSPFLEEAEFMFAMGYYYSSPQPERDQTNTLRAIVSINEYLDRYPASVKRDAMKGYIDELQHKLYDKEYINARCYYNIGKYKSAVVALKNAIDSDPTNPHREEMMYLAAKSSYLLATNSLPDLQMDRYLKMMDSYLNFASEFPDSKYAKELGKMMDDAKAYVSKHSSENNANKHNTSTEDGTKKE